MFVGQHERVLDGKGRLALPAAFRSLLGEQGYLVDVGNCLAVYTEEGFRESVRRLEDAVRGGTASADTLRVIAASAHHVEPDAQGRIVVPAGHRKSAALEGEAIIIGSINRIEIWDPASWTAIRASQAADATEGTWL